MGDMFQDPQWMPETSGSIYSVDTLDKGMIHVPGGMEQDSMIFYHATRNGVQFKTYFWNFPLNVFRLHLTAGN